MTDELSVVPYASLDRRILVIRGLRVMLDADLAEVYGVTTKRLNEQVKRNKGRFPADFMFRLTVAESAEVVANCDHLRRLKFSPVLPFAFTEHGALMAASVLNTERAIQASVFVVRAFVALREIFAGQKQLAAKLNELETRLDGHDEALHEIVAAIRELAEPLTQQRGRRIGFRVRATRARLAPRAQQQRRGPHGP